MPINTDTVRPETTISWLRAHERLLIVFMVLLAGSWAYSRYADIRVAMTDARATAAEQALKSQKDVDAQNQAQITQLTQQYQQLTQVLAAQNAQLASSISQRQAAQTVQVATDAHLAPNDLATRLQTLGNALPEEVSVGSEGKINLTQSGAVKITQSLEQIAPLQADLKDTTDTLRATQIAQTKADDLIAADTKQIDSLNLTLIDQTKQCTAEKAELKVQARRSKIRWFKLGFVSGFVSGLWAGHAAGI